MSITVVRTRRERGLLEIYGCECWWLLLDGMAIDIYMNERQRHFNHDNKIIVQNMTVRQWS